MWCDVNESENWSCAMKYWDKNGSGLEPLNRMFYLLMFCKGTAPEHSLCPQHLSGNTEQVASGQDYSLFAIDVTSLWCCAAKCRWRTESDFLQKKQSNRISLCLSVALFLISPTKKPTRVCSFLLFTNLETKKSDGKMPEKSRSSPFVCSPEEQRWMMPVCLMTTASNLPHVALFMKYYR